MSAVEPLLFDEATHTYTVGSATLPSVTEIIRPLVDYAAIPAIVLENARQKGDAIHYAIRLGHENDLDISTLHDAIVPRYEAWLKFQQDTGFLLDGHEQPMCSRIYNYAGTPDFWGTMNDGNLLVDIKPNSLLKWYPIQLSGYQQLIRENVGMKTRRATLRLMDDGNYKFLPYQRNDDAVDFSVFNSCLQLLNWRIRNECYKRND